MKRWRRLLLGSVAVSAVLLTLGNWRDPWLWAYIAVFVVILAAALLTLDEDLARERFHPPNPGADRLSLRVVRIVAALHIAVSLVDNRLGFSHVPGVVRAIGLGGFAGGFGLILYSMRVNRFFSAVVRVQTDRGHRVIDQGPYGRLRHPGYAGMIVSIPMSGLAMGSWYGALVGLVY